MPNVAGWPIVISPTCCSGTVKSTLIVSSCCSVAITVPGWTYCPTSTRGMPMVPAKGASIDFWSSTACDLRERRFGGGERALRVLERGVGVDAASCAASAARSSAPGRARAPPAPTSGRRARPHRRSAREARPASTCSLALKSIDLHHAGDLRGDVDALDRRRACRSRGSPASRWSARPRSPKR